MIIAQGLMDGGLAFQVEGLRLSRFSLSIRASPARTPVPPAHLAIYGARCRIEGLGFTVGFGELVVVVQLAVAICRARGVSRKPSRGAASLSSTQRCRSIGRGPITCLGSRDHLAGRHVSSVCCVEANRTCTRLMVMVSLKAFEIVLKYCRTACVAGVETTCGTIAASRGHALPRSAGEHGGKQCEHVCHPGAVQASRRCRHAILAGIHSLPLQRFFCNRMNGDVKVIANGDVKVIAVYRDGCPVPWCGATRCARNLCCQNSNQYVAFKSCTQCSVTCS